MMTTCLPRLSFTLACMRSLASGVALILAVSFACGQRARDLGVPFDGTPGPLNAITDVRGLEVGDTTLISGSGRLKVGEGPVRTGVTVVFPRGKTNPDPVYAG